MNRYESRMKKTAKELDALIGGWLEEHKQKRLLDKKRKEEQDFMDVMLNTLKDAKISGFDADTINKATCLASSSSDFNKTLLVPSQSCLLM